MLLDQEGLEVDPVDRLEADIPLHKAVRFVNGLGKDEWEAGAGIVELLLDAGADPRFVLFSFLLFLPDFKAGCLCYPILSIGGIYHTHKKVPTNTNQPTKQ